MVKFKLMLVQTFSMTAKSCSLYMIMITDHDLCILNLVTVFSVSAALVGEYIPLLKK